MLPLAIQYGMSEYQFWHGDMRLLEVYQKAYLRNISYNAWVQGQHNKIAFGIIMANAFAKKGAPQVEYPEWVDPMEKYQKKKIKKEEVEQEFRQQQIAQNAWLFNRI